MTSISRCSSPARWPGGYAYYDPVQQGAYEAAYGTPGANQGKNTAFAIASTWPFGPGALEFNSWLMYGGGNDANEKDGVQNVSWTPEQLETFRKAWEEVLAEEMAANPDLKRLMDSYNAFHENYRGWGERAYLK